MRVVVDVDGVLAAHFEPYASEVRSGRGAEIRAADLNTWDVPDGETDVLTEVTDRLGDPSYLERVPPIEDAARGIASLREAGHEVVIATHRPAHTHPTTRQWLADHDIVVDEYVSDVPDNKGLVEGDVLIDDYHGNVRDAMDAGMAGLLFRQPWNRLYADEFDAEEIVYRWRDVPDAIARL